ncbi:MAG: hypothetical protein SXA11_20400 [Cyanobacteriota bacterium]|nr:hypothetical protein [Cyanobacteriota bacterium]
MLGINWRQTVRKTILTSVITVVLMTGLGGCGDRLPELPSLGEVEEAISVQVPEISEVSPPTAIQKLGRVLDRYQPQVSIVSPKPEEVLEDNIINVQLEVKDLPIFKSYLGLGPHLEVILDNQPYKKIYDLDEPLSIEDLEPGTHTLRVFANRPWNESFKNEGAYAESTFHVFTKTPNNNPESGLPLLTYNSPRGFYGSEPILLDFYLKNAPLHFVAEENPEDDIVDWRVRVTVNGTSFSSDRWQPMYLKGFKPGKNWIKLEFIDELGNPINNVYNNTARLITYEPGDPDTLSKLVRGEIPLTEVLAIVDPSYKPETVEPEALPATPPPEEMEESSSVTSTLEEVGDRYLRGQEELSPALIPALQEKEAPETTTIEEEETPTGELLIEEIVEEEPASVGLSAPEAELPAAVPTIEEEETPAGELLIEEIIEEEPATVDLLVPEAEIPAAVLTIEEEETPTGELLIEEEPAKVDLLVPEAEIPAAVLTIEGEETPTGELLIEEIVEEEPATVDLLVPEAEIPAAVPTIVEPLPDVETITQELNKTETTDDETLLNGLIRRFKGFGIGTSTQQEPNNTETTGDETLLNSLIRRFKGFGIGTSTEEPAEVQTETATEEPENLGEEKFNFGKLLNGWRNRFIGGSETVPPTVVPTLPEIVEEGPVPEPAEELSPQESANLIPEKEAITEEIKSEAVEESIAPEIIVSPSTSQLELEPVPGSVTSEPSEETISPETTLVPQAISGEKEAIKEEIEFSSPETLELLDNENVTEVIEYKKEEKSGIFGNTTTEKIVVIEKNDPAPNTQPELPNNSEFESEIVVTE